jgi:FkbM family methyltransferase
MSNAVESARATGIAAVLDAAAVTPVLADVGASGTRRPVWEALAARSILIAFDPDERDPPPDLVGAYREVRMVTRAVTDSDERDSVQFVLTEYPHSSSTLEPDLAALGDYSFRDYFRPVSRVEVPATSLNRVIRESGLPGIDWIKLDSQGTDLRILAAMEPEFLRSMMAIEVEPGFIDAYLGEDLYPEVHQFLKAEGYWLAELAVQQYARIRPASLEALRAHCTGTLATDPLVLLRKSPTAAEASYLRRRDQARTERERVLLFVFSVVQGLLGFAWDCLCDQRLASDGSAVTTAMQALFDQEFEAAARSGTQRPVSRPTAPQPQPLSLRLERRIRRMFRGSRP